MDDLIRDMRLTKENAKLLTSRLKEWHLLDPTCKISKHRKRHLNFAYFFTLSESHSLCYCSDIFALFNELGIDYKPSDWLLFIDSSVKSLKAVLLHNGNKFPSIPVGHSAHMKEEYRNVKALLDMINYTSHNSELCGDFKMLAFLLGQQGGYTKYSCFLCLCNSRADDQHYSRKQWLLREEFTPGAHNVICQPPVLREKILLPTLHIKLGLAKQFIKTLKSDSKALSHVQAMFPKLSEAKVKGGIFTGQQIRQMLGSKELEDKMIPLERDAWQSFRNGVHGFLGKNKTDNYTCKYSVETVLQAYCKLGSRMSLKMHYLHSHLDFFRPNLTAVSEKHDERFHRNIQRYQERWDEIMMGDFVWTLIRDDKQMQKRRCRSRVNF